VPESPGRTATLLHILHCHSVSDFNLGPRILHTLLQPGRQKSPDNVISDEKQRRKARICCCCSISFCNLGFDRGTTLLAQRHKNKSHVLRWGFLGDHTVAPRRPIHLPVKWLSSHARTKLNMWWCFICREMHFLAIVRLSSNTLCAYSAVRMGRIAVHSDVQLATSHRQDRVRGPWVGSHDCLELLARHCTGWCGM